MLIFLLLRFSHVRPFNNPTETYRYYSLPFCRAHAADDENEAVESATKREGALSHKQHLGESIVGDRRETSPYDISFLDSVDWRMLCKTSLKPADLRRLVDAVRNNYFFEMFVEDLPMWVRSGSFRVLSPCHYPLSKPITHIQSMRGPR